MAEPSLWQRLSLATVNAYAATPQGRLGAADIAALPRKAELRPLCAPFSKWEECRKIVACFWIGPIGPSA
jgi:hypothetical protein